jgi:hypothetical protein
MDVNWKSMDKEEQKVGLEKVVGLCKEGWHRMTEEERKSGKDQHQQRPLAARGATAYYSQLLCGGGVFSEEGSQREDQFTLIGYIKGHLRGHLRDT